MAIKVRSIWFYSPIGNVWLCNPQHVDCCLVKLDEDTIMDLKKAKQLENLSHLRTHSIDTWSKRSDQPLKMLFATSWKLSCRMSTFYHYKVKYHSTFLVSLEAMNLSNRLISWSLMPTGLGWLKSVMQSCHYGKVCFHLSCVYIPRLSRCMEAIECRKTCCWKRDLIIRWTKCAV